MNDPISEMTDKDILNACLDIVGYPGCAAPIYPYHNVVGLIIHKLQEWGCGINYPFNEKKWFSYHAGFMKSIEDVSLQVAFLRTAQALGHWSPPKKVEESFYYWRNKISGHIVEMRPEFIASMATHPEEWQRVRVTPFEK